MGVGERKLAGAMPAGLNEMREWIGWRVDDVYGASLGRLQEVIPDESGRPAWLVINEFRFASGRRFTAPAREATGSRGRVWLPLDRKLVIGSAGLGSTHHSVQAERRLRAYYAIPKAA